MNYRGERGFIVDQTEDRLHLYLPSGSLRYRQVPVDDPALERMTGIPRANIFSQP